MNKACKNDEKIENISTGVKLVKVPQQDTNPPYGGAPPGGRYCP